MELTNDDLITLINRLPDGTPLRERLLDELDARGAHWEPETDPSVRARTARIQDLVTKKVGKDDLH